MPAPSQRPRQAARSIVSITAGFGIVTITKSISIVCGYAENGVLAASVNGIIIDAPAGSKVTLKGQDIDCAGTGINGIEMIGVGVTLHVHKSQIRNCRGAGGNGILITPSSGAASLFVTDSTITDNGAAVNNAGLLVRPTGGASASVSINRDPFRGQHQWHLRRRFRWRWRFQREREQ